MARKGFCYCGQKLGDAGTCFYRCPPEADPVNLRKQRAARRERDRQERLANQINLSKSEHAQAAKVAAELNPSYRAERERLQRAAVNSHRIGSRR